jgi:hypothetical protein
MLDVAEADVNVLVAAGERRARASLDSDSAIA